MILFAVIYELHPVIGVVKLLYFMNRLQKTVIELKKKKAIVNISGLPEL